MRPNERGTIGAFASAGLGEFDRKILLHTRLVFEAQVLGVVGNAAISQARERGEFGSEIVPEADDFIAETDKFVGEAVESGFVGLALFQQSIARAQGLRVTLKQRQIGTLRL